MGKRRGKKSRATGKRPDERERTRLAFSREVEMGDANAARRRSAWRDKMMNLNLPIVKEDLQSAWRTFDRALDNKDYSISILLDSLDSAAEEKRKSDITHTDQICKILRVYKQHMDDFHEDYQASLGRMIDENQREVTDVGNEQNEKENFLQATIFSTQQTTEEFVENTRTKNMSKFDSIKESNENERRMLTFILKRRMQNFSETLAAVLRDYENNTSDKRKDFEKLRKKDEEGRKVIESQAKRVESLYEMVQSYRDKIKTFQLESEKDLANYRFERDFFQNAYTIFQNKLKQEQALDKHQLKIMTTEYSKTVTYLNHCLEKLEKISSVVDLCEKYVGYEDKLPLFPLSAISPQENDDCDVDSIAQRVLPLKKFIKIIMTTNRSVTHLRSKCDELKKTSNCLRSNLKSYMDSISRTVNECQNPDAISFSVFVKNII